MATPIQNAVKVLDALYNGTMPTDLRDRIIAAFAPMTHIQGPTNDQIATAFLAFLREHVKDRLKSAERQALSASNDQAIDASMTPLP